MDQKLTSTDIAGLPAEIAELRDLADTAAEKLQMADAAYAAARAEAIAADAKAASAGADLDDADQDEAAARSAYVAALRRHGYVQTADGPRPAVSAR